MLSQSRLILISAVLAATLTIGCVSISKQSSKPGFFKYENQKYGFSIDYSSSWLLNGESEGRVSFVTPGKTPQSWYPSLSIEIENISSEDALNYFSKQLNNSFALLEEPHIIEFTNTTIFGNRAEKLLYTGVLGDYNLTFLRIWTVKGHKGYVIEYEAQTDEFSGKLGIVNEMIDSFKFTQ